MLNSLSAAATHAQTDTTVIPAHYNRKTLFGQSFFVLLSVYFQIPAGEGSIQLGKNAVVLLRPRLVGGWLEIVPPGNGADAGRYDGQLSQSDVSLPVPDNLLLHQRRVVVLGGAVAAEAEIPQRVEKDTAAVFLNGLQDVGMGAEYDVRPGVNGGVTHPLLFFGGAVGTLHAPVGGEDDQVHPLLPQSGDLCE